MLDNKEEMQENLKEIEEIAGSSNFEYQKQLLLAAILAELQEIKYMLYSEFNPEDIIEWDKTESV